MLRAQCLGAEPEGQSVPVQLHFLSELASKLPPPHPTPSLPTSSLKLKSLQVVHKHWPFSIQRVAITSA